VSDRGDEPPTGPAEQRTVRSGKPPVPPRAPAVPAPTPDGQHRTERVPYPLPALPPQGAPPPVPGPETGRLHLTAYPPRVPGAGRPAAAPAVEDEDVDHDR